MPDALRLNGLKVPVLRGSWQRPGDVVIGERGRGTSGRMEVSLRSRRRTYRGKLVPQSTANARAWRGFLECRGFSWSFDSDNNGARGVAPSAIVGNSSVAGKWGNALRLAVTTGTVTYPVGASEWTVMVWRKAGGSFEHWFVRSDAVKYLDGAVTGSSSAWLTVTTSSLTIAAGVTQTDIDDLVFLPYLAPTTWVADFFAEMGARAWTGPFYRATGDLIANAPLTLCSRVSGGEPVAAMRSGALDRTGEAIEFELEEAA